MRIKITNGGSFKNSPNFESEEELIEKLDLDEVNHYDLMIKVKNKGDEVYAYVDPYKEEIDGMSVLYWSKNPSTVEVEFLSSLENI